MIYVAFLRSINVGGKNKIKMAELRTVLQSMGLHNVKTYIQSGNVLFESVEKEESLCKQIASKINENFGVNTTVILRTGSDINTIIKNYPFSEADISKAEAASEYESQYVAFLGEALNEKDINQLIIYCNENENFQIIGRDVYLLLSDSIRHSKLAKKINQLETSSTVRNWKTLNKLKLMVNELEHESKMI